MRLSLDRLAQEARRRRGSRAGETVPIGYHCTHWPLTGAFSGHLREYLERHYTSIVESLPYSFHDRLYDRGLDRLESDPGEVLAALDRMGVRVVFVAERPLDDSGGLRRSGFGGWCYLVHMPVRAVLGSFVDHQVATGRDNAAYGVLYDGSVGTPTLEEIDKEGQVPQVEMPL